MSERSRLDERVGVQIVARRVIAVLAVGWAVDFGLPTLPMR
jgi:hypothetical protein